ncbi:MAG: HAMP domain-containing histidine kinase [Lachnospiraceae bacterium]|nr:HAMP domain-containing histidine kinase [Lachnospiraceae bacterium]
MSSNPKEKCNEQLQGEKNSATLFSRSGRVSSMVYRLEWLFVRKKLGIYLGQDFVTTVILCLGWMAQVEYETMGNLDFERLRTITGTKWPELYYQVSSTQGDFLFSQSIAIPTLILGVLFGTMVLFQSISIIVEVYGEVKRLRKILSPLNEFALKTDEFTRLAMDEEKLRALDENQVHAIEDAIEHVTPRGEEKITLGDSELEGIEAAVNNMIIRLRESYRQQTRFVNDASHELRTPIAVIQGYANMLLRWGKKDEKVLEESIQAIAHEADHMNILVEQLLFLARGDSGKTTLKKEKLVLNQLMQEIYEESLLIDEEHVYSYENATESLEVEADPTLLKQAVRILVDNAAKYTNPKDEIILRVGRKEDGRPYLMVEDTGIGMNEADVEHMFERFYRADDARSYQGTGLGLSIAKWIVDRHGGYFEILSRAGLGTRIMIVL